MTALDADSSADIEAPSDVVFAIVADLELLPKWLPGVTIARCLERDEDGRATLAHTELGTIIRRSHAHLRIAPEASTVGWVLGHGEVHLAEACWTLRDLRAGCTRAQYAVRIDFDHVLDLLSRGPASEALRSAAGSLPDELNAFIAAHSDGAQRRGRRPATGQRMQPRPRPALRSHGVRLPARRAARRR